MLLDEARELLTKGVPPYRTGHQELVLMWLPFWITPELVQEAFDVLMGDEEAQREMDAFYWVPTVAQRTILFPNGREKNPISFMDAICRRAVDDCQEQKRVTVPQGIFNMWISMEEEKATQEAHRREEFIGYVVGSREKGGMLVNAILAWGVFADTGEAKEKTQRAMEVLMQHPELAELFLGWITEGVIEAGKDLERGHKIDRITIMAQSSVTVREQIE